jgi:hypothetical protein
MTKEFILDTLLPYKKDSSLCAIDNGCVYLTPNGKKCAVGKHLIEGEHQKFVGDIYDLDAEYNLNNILTEEAQRQNISLQIWELMQQYHDFIALKKSFIAINNTAKLLEKHTHIQFPELYME